MAPQCALPLGGEIVAQETHVAAIGAERNIEGIAQQGHRANNALDSDVRDHAQEYVARHAQAMRFIEQEAGKARRGHVTDSWNQPQYCFNAKPDVRAGDDECDIEKLRQAVEPFEAPRGVRSAGDETRCRGQRCWP